jgi:PAS domain S-box-containing protein
MSTGHTAHTETEGVRDDGSRFSASINAFPILNEEGHPTGFIEIVEDITERKKAEKTLRESEERYRRIFENSVVGIFQSTPEGRYISVNHALAKMLGYSSPADLISSISDISEQYYVDPEDRHQYQQILQKDEIVENFEFRAKRKNGSQIWVSSSTRAYFDQYGKVVSYEGIVVDITDRKRVEEERLVLEAQLQQAHKMEAIGTLAGGIAHDFNNILGIILGNAELALDDISEGDRTHFNLEEIRAAGQRARAVVKQLLSFARKTELEQKPIKLIPVVKDSIKFLRSMIPTSIDIRQNILATDETVLADPTQIHQVMINLCTNASHAMQETGGILGIEIESVLFEKQSDAPHPDLSPGSYVKLTVSDTGQGIPPELMDRIFDPYFTTKEIGKGTGMGLSVVHGIVSNCGGTISVESEVEKGTTFYIYFPVIEEESVIETETIEELPTGNERILFVDDDKSLIYACRYRLERLGYQVETKTNPVEALELFRSNPERFDLIITDMSMPQMTGDHFVEEILKIRPDTPTILCTGFSEMIDEKKAKEIGATEYIEKPIDKRDLAIKIRSVLDGKR